MLHILSRWNDYFCGRKRTLDLQTGAISFSYGNFLSNVLYSPISELINLFNEGCLMKAATDKYPLLNLQKNA